MFNQRPKTPTVTQIRTNDSSNEKQKAVRSEQQLKSKTTNRETLNEAYKYFTLQTLDMLLRIKKPNKLAFDACRILCLFINSFRDFDKKWPNEAFTSWVTVQHFLVASPSTQKILKET